MPRSFVPSDVELSHGDRGVPGRLSWFVSVMRAVGENGSACTAAVTSSPGSGHRIDVG